MRAPSFRLPAVRTLARVRAAVDQAVQLGLDLVFPPECAACQAPLETAAAHGFCAPCQAQLIDAADACPRCGSRRPAGFAVAACPHCRELAPRFVATVRLGRYDGSLRAAVLAIKRPYRQPLAVALGQALAAACVQRMCEDPPDVIVPIPMHWLRRLRRGTNSPIVLSRCVAASFGVPQREDLLIRSRRTVPQARLSPAKRRANVKGAFRVRPHRDLAGSHVLLVDDIMTTGATLNEATKVLLKAQVRAVSVAVVARAEGLV